MLTKSALSYVVSNEDETVVVPAPIVEAPIDPAAVAVAETVIDPAMPINPAVVSPVDAPSSAIAVPVEEVVQGPVDITAVTEAPLAMDVIDEVQSEQCAIQERADALLDMQHALEHYTVLIRQTGLEGISKEGAAFMKVGLNMIQKSLGTDLVVSSESLDTIDPRSSRVKSTISVESVKEMASKAYNSFVEAIKKLIALIEKGWDHVLDFGNDQERTIDAMLERVKKIKVTAASEEITIRNPSLLFANGDEVFPETKALFGLTHFALVAYPKAMEMYYSDLAKYTRSISKLGDDYELSYEEVSANIDSVGKPLTKLKEASSTDSFFNGNHVIDVAEDGLSFGVKVGEGSEAPTEVELVVEAPVKIRKMLNDIKLINKMIIDYRPANQRVHKAAEGLLKSTEDISNKEITRKLLQVVKASSPRNREIVSFVCKVTRAYLAVISQMISAHESVKTK